MAVPKRRTSKSRKGLRRGSDAHQRPLRGAGQGPQCGAIKQPHRVCPSCGSYAGRQVLAMSTED